MAPRKRKEWLGGYRRQGKRGEVFIIEKWIGGTKFHVSTRCNTERGALKQLEIFEANPSAYKPEGVAPLESLRMTADLLFKYETFQLDIKQNVTKYVNSNVAYLEAWMEALDGADIRELTTADIKDKLAKWTSAKRPRVIALKGFCTWLRREKGLLKHSEDPTIDLMVPEFKAAKLKRQRYVEESDVLAVLGKLDPGPHRDVLRLLAATGLHITEARRFARDGELFEPSPEQAKEALANLAVKHKSGDLHIVAISDPEVLEAAKRLRAAGDIPPNERLADKMRDASDAAGVKPRVTLGVMRHSVATWLARAGTPLAQIADFLGHRSPVTTAKFYRDMGRSARPLPVPKLRLVKG